MTRYVLDRLLATCSSDPLADTRDLAILLLAFASGGRLRSEVARLRVEPLSEEPLVSLDPLDPKSPTLPCMAIQLGRTKTGNADDEGRVLLVGRPVEARREWLERADISKGPIFRAIDRWEALDERWRAWRRGSFPLEVGLSDGGGEHRSVQQAASYYNDVESVRRAARLGVQPKVLSLNSGSLFEQVGPTFGTAGLANGRASQIRLTSARLLLR